MSIADKLDELHAAARANRWLRYFAVFNRIVLAAGFLPSGMQKILGERFTVLPVQHPMGHYLDALYQTGYYYTSIGVMQVVAAVLLLIPRTATLGAVIYFPIILNICILSLAVRFEGSLLTSPLMLLANLFLLCWDYHKLRYLFPWNRSVADTVFPREGPDHKFPVTFFAGVVAVISTVILVCTNAFDIMPRNTITECREQCQSMEDPDNCYAFCDCIHREGLSLDQCLELYDRDPEDLAQCVECGR